MMPQPNSIFAAVQLSQYLNGATTDIDTSGIQDGVEKLCPSLLKDVAQKTHFLWGVLAVRVQYIRIHYTLKLPATDPGSLDDRRTKVYT
jgi:hypothetical protein